MSSSKPTKPTTTSLTTQIRLALAVFVFLGTAAVVTVFVRDPIGFFAQKGAVWSLPLAFVAAGVPYAITKTMLVRRALVQALRDASEEDVAAARGRAKEIEANFVHLPAWLAGFLTVVEASALSAVGEFAAAAGTFEDVRVNSFRSALVRAGLLDEKAFYVALAGDGRRSLAIADEALSLLKGDKHPERTRKLRNAIHRTKAVACVVAEDYARAIEVFDLIQPDPDHSAWGEACIDFHHAQALLSHGDRERALLLLERAGRRRNKAGNPPLWARRAADRLAQLRTSPHRAESTPVSLTGAAWTPSEAQRKRAQETDEPELAEARQMSRGLAIRTAIGWVLLLGLFALIWVFLRR